jgi:hypothetical protein
MIRLSLETKKAGLLIKVTRPSLRSAVPDSLGPVVVRPYFSIGLAFSCTVY